MYVHVCTTYNVQIRSGHARKDVLYLLYVSVGTYLMYKIMSYVGRLPGANCNRCGH
jgi:hypothetical protein